MNKLPLASTLLLLASLAGSGTAHADVAACRCSCGEILDAPCSDDDCLRACGDPAVPAPYDDAAERQRQEAGYPQQEAEQQRQLELERKKKHDEQAARKRQEDFERAKQRALKGMKGISEGELGLKVSDAGESGLKDSGDSDVRGLKGSQARAPRPAARKMECAWGDLDAAVDLRCLGLDPDRPIVAARGEARAFPARPDPATFGNISYRQGFEALMRLDAASAADAVSHFRQAQKERPKDPLVRNALLLAQDILKARQLKEPDDQTQATYYRLQSYAALMMGDHEKAQGYIAQARNLAPKDDNIRFVESLAKNDPGAAPARRDAYRLVANSLVSIDRRNLTGALRTLQAAQRLQPQDRFISGFVAELRRYGIRK